MSTVVMDPESSLPISAEHTTTDGLAFRFDRARPDPTRSREPIAPVAPTSNGSRHPDQRRFPSQAPTLPARSPRGPRHPAPPLTRAPHPRVHRDTRRLTLRTPGLQIQPTPQRGLPVFLSQKTNPTPPSQAKLAARSRTRRRARWT